MWMLQRQTRLSADQEVGIVWGGHASKLVNSVTRSGCHCCGRNREVITQIRTAHQETLLISLYARSTPLLSACHRLTSSPSSETAQLATSPTHPFPPHLAPDRTLRVAQSIVVPLLADQVAHTRIIPRRSAPPAAAAAAVAPGALAAAGSGTPAGEAVTPETPTRAAPATEGVLRADLDAALVFNNSQIATLRARIGLSGKGVPNPLPPRRLQSPSFLSPTDVAPVQSDSLPSTRKAHRCT